MVSKIEISFYLMEKTAQFLFTQEKTENLFSLCFTKNFMDSTETLNSYEN